MPAEQWGEIRWQLLANGKGDQMFVSNRSHSNKCKQFTWIFTSRILPVLRSLRSVKVNSDVDKRAIIVQLRWVRGSEQEAGAYVTCRFGADSSIILKFIAICVEARGDSPFVLQPAFNSSLVKKGNRFIKQSKNSERAAQFLTDSFARHHPGAPNEDIV